MFTTSPSRLKIVLLLLIFTGYSSTLHAQWKWVHPSPQGNNLNSVYFLDANTGWTAGDAGALLNTTDGGNTWNVQNCGFFDALTGVYFFDADSGYLASSNNFLSSNDGGNSWTIKYRFSNLYMGSMFFLNKDSGWVAGDFNGLYSLYATFDGGLTWNWQISNISNKISCVQIKQNGSGWITGENGLFATTSNFGTSWNYTSPAGTTNLTSVNFTDTQLGFITGEQGTLLKSINGGLNWSPVTNPAGVSVNLNCVNFSDPNSGIISGTNGALYSTVNGGSNWTNVSRPSWFTGNAIAGISVSDFVLVGSNGEILKSLNVGASWTSKQSRVSENDLKSVSAANSTTLYACGNAGTVIKSINSGLTWSALNTGTLTDFNGIAALSTSDVVITGQSGFIYYSSNGGTNWNLATSGTSENILSVSKATSTILFACGDNSTILKSTNSGATWTDQSNPLTGAGFKFLDIYFAGQDTGYVATDGAEILYTTNGGNNWHLFSTSANPPIRSVHFINGRHGWAVSGAGDVLETTDNGVNWNVIYNANGYTLDEVVFTDAQNGWAFGDGKILRSNDGGISWGNEFTPSGQLIHDAVFLNNTDAIAVGEGLATVIARSGDLTIDISNNLLCTDNSYTVNVNATGTFNPGNKFTVQLSNEFAEFTFPINVGSIAATSSTPIQIYIPAGLTDASGYRLRVISTDPPVFSALNAVSLILHTSPDAIAYALDPTFLCGGDSVTIYAVTGNGWTYQWNVDGNILTGFTADTIRVGSQGSYTVTTSDGICSSTSFPVDVTECIGIMTHDSQNLFSVYPNPTKGIVTVNWPENTRVDQIRVYDLTGRLLEIVDHPSSSDTKLGLENYQKGMYIIKITGEKSGTLKVTKF